MSTSTLPRVPAVRAHVRAHWTPCWCDAADPRTARAHHHKTQPTCPAVPAPPRRSPAATQLQLTSPTVMIPLGGSLAEPPTDRVVRARTAAPRTAPRVPAASPSPSTSHTLAVVTSLASLALGLTLGVDAGAAFALAGALLAATRSRHSRAARHARRAATPAPPTLTTPPRTVSPTGTRLLARLDDPNGVDDGR